MLPKIKADFPFCWVSMAACIICVFILTFIYISYFRIFIVFIRLLGWWGRWIYLFILFAYLQIGRHSNQYLWYTCICFMVFKFDESVDAMSHHLPVCWCFFLVFNALRPTQNSRNFLDIFKWIFLNEYIWITLSISLKFVPKDFNIG